MWEIFRRFLKFFFWFVARLANGAKTFNVTLVGVEKTDWWAGCFCFFVILFFFSVCRCLLCLCLFLLFVVVFSLLLLFWQLFVLACFAVLVYESIFLVVAFGCHFCLSWLCTTTCCCCSCVLSFPVRVFCIFVVAVFLL